MLFTPHSRGTARALIWTAGALLSSSVAVAQPAANPPAAQPRSEAEVRFERGFALFGARNFEGALVEFQRAYALSRRADLLFNIGRCLQALGRYPEAATAVQTYLREARDLPPARRAEVNQMVEQLRGFIAHVHIRVTPPGAAISLDGERIPAERAADIAVGPGRHSIEASADGFTTAQRSVVVASGDDTIVTIDLARAAAQTPSGPTTAPSNPADNRPATLLLQGAPEGATLEVDGRPAGSPAQVPPGSHRLSVRASGHATWSGEVTVRPGERRTLTARLTRAGGLSPTWFIAGAVTTGVFLIAGMGAGLATASTHDTFLQRDREDPEARSLANRGETLRTLTNVSFGLAAAAGVATVILLTRTRFGASRPSTVDVAVMPNGAGGGHGTLAVRF